MRQYKRSTCSGQNTLFNNTAIGLEQFTYMFEIIKYP